MTGGFKIDGSASCWAFGADFRRGRDRAPSWPADHRDRGSRTAWLEKAAGWAFARPRADATLPSPTLKTRVQEGSRTVEGLDGDLSLVHVGVLDDAVAAERPWQPWWDVHEGDGAAAEKKTRAHRRWWTRGCCRRRAVVETLSHGARKLLAHCATCDGTIVVPQEAIGPAKTLKTAQQKNRNFQAGEIFFGEREAENAPNLRMATRHSLV